MLTKQGSSALSKRALDVTASVLGLVLTSPALGVICAAIKLDSPGPVLFRQDRVGRGGRTFRIHKFRTMRASHDGRLVSGTGDVRVTRVGRVLRKSKLDELPQLLDVLRGDMSLVGPRPEVPVYVAQWPPEMRDLILSVRPGITDPASIEFRNEADELAAAPDPETYYVQELLPRKTAAYAQYVRTRSFTKDLVVLGQTLRAVISG
ncbi:O-antigen biosynthesis protein WlbG [Terrabacter aerolatus]|uniref:Sugar transferase n=1 Tax=Terrabacter aerolatus TaxID=422442 RepID=A0A512CZR2_9MICO|nr:sugar transferase [Terrabacter aerolatus]GEO29701.1 sugar transferase [Terrabacter aerolatus]